MMHVQEWDKIQKRFLAFWNCEMEDRCIVTATAYKPGGKADYQACRESLAGDKRYRDLFHLTADPEVKIKNQIARFEFLHYAGDALPILDTSIGPGMSAAFLGSIVKINTDGVVWFEHTVEEWDKRKLAFDKSNIWWILTKNLVEKAAKEAQDKYLVSICGDIYSGIDTLMLLRGTENLCFDLIDSPEIIKENCRIIMKYWKQQMDTLFATANPFVDGNACGWLKFWGPGKTYPIQCDFMNMISTAMFEEYVVPDTIEMCQYLDNAIFHFDGPDEAVRHLPYLLDIKELKGIQWNPKTNYENVRHIPTLKKIQAAGKCLILNTTPEEIEPLLAELSPKGLMLNIYPFNEPFASPEEAESIVEKVRSLCK